MNVKDRNYDFWVNVIIAFSLGLAASFVYSLITDFKIEILSLSILNLVLATLLVFSINLIKSLIFKTDKLEYSEYGEPRQILINEVLNSLIKYNYIKNINKEEQVKKLLITSKYVRGQNIYYMMHHGIFKVKSQVLFINDHPFKPFSDLINANIPISTSYLGVGAIPDELYPKEDVIRRIQIIKERKVEYYFLPDNEVHLSMVIFDTNAAILYSTPKNRNVCNFSEGLLLTDKRTVKEFTDVFFHVYDLAKKRYKGNIDNVINELENLTSFYMGPLS